MGRKNQVLNGGPQVLRDVAMGTSIWLSIGYNFACMIASNTLILGWVFGVKLSDEDIGEIECLWVVVTATNFGTKIAITGFV